MKKLMLSTAVAALAFAATPALAQDDAGVKLNLGGYFKGYMNYANQDDDGLGAGQDVRDLDILRETEVHFGGETTLDNGLTVGAQIEADAQSDQDFLIDESYAYFAGSWGRVNFGEEDGAAYLLQVAAPAADENIDGIRQFINPVNFTALGVGQAVDYANDFAVDSEKLTYLSPVFNGFQAGVSYTPEQDATANRTDGNSTDDVAGDIGSVYEAAVRYEGAFNNVGFIAGAGYTHGDLEDDAGTNDDFQEWNVGLDLDIGAFGVGAIYTENNNGDDTEDENETWVFGADYTTGPFKVGASYLNNEEDLGTDSETDRYAAGVTYTYGPGMTFRGSVNYLEADTTAADGDSTNVLLGTQINF